MSYYEKYIARLFAVIGFVCGAVIGSFIATLILMMMAATK